jgi:hypothetical protein
MKLLPLALALLPITATPALANVSNTNGTLVSQASSLPTSIATAVLQTHAYTLNQPQYLFRISQATAQNWPDGCLGLADPYEFCAQSIVPGWRVVVSDGVQEWVYRTDSSGLSIRPEPGSTLIPPANQPNSNGWQTQLRWSKVTDAAVPTLVYQLSVLRKPTTTYASVVYQFYARQRGETNWTYFYTTVGARLIDNAAVPVDLPLETTPLNQFRTTLGESYNWSKAEIRVAVLIRYDLSRQQRDIPLRFEHQQFYTDIPSVSLAQLTGQPTAPAGFQSQPQVQPFPTGSTDSTVSSPAVPPGVPVLPPLSTPYPGMPSSP